MLSLPAPKPDLTVMPVARTVLAIRLLAPILSVINWLLPTPRREAALLLLASVAVATKVITPAIAGLGTVPCGTGTPNTAPSFDSDRPTFSSEVTGVPLKVTADA